MLKASQIEHMKNATDNKLPTPQPFFQDDKFPLPSRNSLFAGLTKAHIYSKFDLKAKFWQLVFILKIDPWQSSVFQTNIFNVMFSLLVSK